MKHNELVDRAKFFSEKLLGIPYIYDVRFATRDDEDFFELVFSKERTRGCFFARGDGYGNEGFNALLREEAIESGDDPELVSDQEEAFILIAPYLQRINNRRDLNCVLIHELIHYKLWWLGYGHDDGESDFENEVKRLMVSSNYYNKRFNNDKKKWERVYSEEQLARLDEYENMYQEYKKGKKK